MTDTPYYRDITSSDIGYKIDPNQKFVREIRIDDITKTKEHMFITTNGSINKIRLRDLKKIVKLIMEEQP